MYDWTTTTRNAQFSRRPGRVFRTGSGGGLVPRSGTIMEQGAQGADILVFSRPGAVAPGAISLTNINPAGTLQMNADGVTLEYGATLLDRDTATDVSFTASYTDDTGLHSFSVNLTVLRLNIPTGGDFALGFDVTADETGPLLTSPVSAKNGTNAFTGSIITDEASGTLKFVIYPDTAPAPSVTQLEAGQDGNGAACPGGMRSQAVSAVGTQNVSGSGLTAGVWYRIAFLHRDAGTNPSGVVSTSAFQTDNISSAFLGDGRETTSLTVHTFSNSVKVGNTALPAVFAAGKVAVMIGVAGAGNITSVTVDGVAATMRVTQTNGNAVAVWDADIPGGGTGEIVVTTVNSVNSVTISAWQIGGGKSYLRSAFEISNENPTSYNLNVNTAAGDVALVMRYSGNATPPDSSWVNLTEVVPDVTFASRSTVSAHNLNCAGGAPETFTHTADRTFLNGPAVIAIYG